MHLDFTRQVGTHKLDLQSQVTLVKCLFNGFKSQQLPVQLSSKKVGQNEQAMLLLQVEIETVMTVIGSSLITIVILSLFCQSELKLVHISMLHDASCTDWRQL